MQYYCGIDLHSNNHVVVIIDEQDRRVYGKRMENGYHQTQRALEPFKKALQERAVARKLDRDEPDKRLV